MLNRPLTQELTKSLVRSLDGSELIIPLLYMPLISDLSLINGTGTPTFTRASSGTFIDRIDGLLKTSANDVARFEADGYLSEGPSTNLTL